MDYKVIIAPRAIDDLRDIVLTANCGCYSTLGLGTFPWTQGLQLDWALNLRTASPDAKQLWAQRW